MYFKLQKRENQKKSGFYWNISFVEVMISLKENQPSVFITKSIYCEVGLSCHCERTVAVLPCCIQTKLSALFKHSEDANLLLPEWQLIEVSIEVTNLDYLTIVSISCGKFGFQVMSQSWYRPWGHWLVHTCRIEHYKTYYYVFTDERKNLYSLLYDHIA